MRYARGKIGTLRSGVTVPGGTAFPIAESEVDRFKKLGYEIFDSEPSSTKSPISGANNIPPGKGSLGNTGDIKGSPKGNPDEDSPKQLNSPATDGTKMGTPGAAKATSSTKVTPKVTK